MNEAKPSCGWNEAAPSFKMPPTQMIPDFEKQTLTFEHQFYYGTIYREILDLKEQKIREFLIALGWIPPCKTTVMSWPLPEPPESVDDLSRAAGRVLRPNAPSEV